MRHVGLVAVLLVIVSACANGRLAELAEESNAARSGTGEVALFCNEREVGDESGKVVGGFQVIDGELGPLCFGDPDPRILEAWSALTTFTDATQREPLAIIAGFEGGADGTVAFASSLSRFDDRFVIAVELDSAGADRDELYLTMAHEYAHVFTQLPDQIDTEQRRGRCATYHNGFGCFRPDSVIDDWIDQFWPPKAIDLLPKDGTPAEDLGEDRCDLDPSILGSYAGSHPEEDFAETFSAFVFGLAVPTELGPRMDFFDDPRLTGFRDKAEAAGLTDLRNQFIRCG